MNSFVLLAVVLYFLLGMSIALKYIRNKDSIERFSRTTAFALISTFWLPALISMEAEKYLN